MGGLQQILRTPLGLAALLAVGVMLYAGLHASGLITKKEAVALSSASATSSALIDQGQLQQELLLLGISQETNPALSSTQDPIAMIGPMVVAQLAGSYAGLQDSGTYSSTTVAQAAMSVAQNMRAAVNYKTYALADLRTDTDISYKRMLTYRSDMRDALAPLLKNTQNELDLYGKFVETSDSSYLSSLTTAADNYDAALHALLSITVPRDAVNYQLDVLNAMSEFSAVIRQMASHPGDPLASAALLRNYDAAEADMYTSYNALSRYYSQKTP